MGKCSKDNRDLFYRLSKSEGYRARSAYKLIHLDQHFNLFNQSIQNVVDLCAAPGSWSQVLVHQLSHPDRVPPKIVAVDLQPMAPLIGVHQLMGDITLPETAQSIISYFNGQKADLVVCDGAPDVTGLHDLDEFLQSQLLLSALKITLCLLRNGGNLILKIFNGRDVNLLSDQLELFFHQVSNFKPKSSRDSSIESFLICQNFQPPLGFQLDMNSSFFKTPSNRPSSPPSQSIHLQQILRFVACGDLSTDDDPIEPVHPKPLSDQTSINHQTQPLSCSEVESEELISKLTI
ncbi:FtsJ-like methyltransferase-domain-containing protein [Melampsora americana]|nr:FtsJ-like methyltransferase-domain-containing protein [Melampsora americana]